MSSTIIYLQISGGSDLVAYWEVRLSDGVHKIGFEHGTTTGKRIIWVDEKVFILINLVSTMGFIFQFFTGRLTCY